MSMTPADVPVTHHFTELPGVRLHHVEVGQGPLVVLLHGFPETWWSWRYQLGALAAAGYRVVAPDLRGYGESGIEGPFDLDTVTADVGALIASLGAERQVRLVGHDWGGALAWHLAAHHPEWCSRLTVLNCPHPLRMRELLIGKPSLTQLKKSWYMFFFQLPLLPEWVLTSGDAGNLVRMLRASAIDRSHCSAEELRPFRDAIQRPGVAKAMVGWYRDALRGGFSPFRAPPDYPIIGCPTQLIWGMKDPALGFDECVPGTERFVTHLRIEHVDECGHYVQSERPERVNELLLRFFKETP